YADDHLAGTRRGYLDLLEGQLDVPIRPNQRTQLQRGRWKVFWHRLAPCIGNADPAGGIAVMLACRGPRPRSVRQVTSRPGEQLIPAPHNAPFATTKRSIRTGARRPIGPGSARGAANECAGKF